jgi:hypothetical protein
MTVLHTIHPGFPGRGLITMVLSGLLLASVLAASGVCAEALPAAGEKNSCPFLSAGEAGGDTRLTFPAAGEKNGSAPGLSPGPDQVAPATSLRGGGKNEAAADSIPVPAQAMPALLAAGGSLLACGDSGNMNWVTTSGTFQAVRQCQLSVPGDGWVFLSANGSVARSDGPYEAQFEFGIDGIAGDGSVDRWVNVYDDAGDGKDLSVALSVLKPVTAGTHTFYLLGKRYAGTGTMEVYDPTLTAIYIPAVNSEVIACGASGGLNWTTTSDTFQSIRQCELTVPGDGWVFLSADGSVARSDGPYEALFEFGLDGTAGDYNVDRWVNVYDDAGDGTDLSVSLSMLKPVTAGTRTFHLLGRRYNGTGTMLVYDPTLTAVFIPAASLLTSACGASGNLTWTTTEDTFQTVRQCELSLPRDGWVFLSADEPVGPPKVGGRRSPAPLRRRAGGCPAGTTRAPRRCRVASGSVASGN